MTLRLTVAVVLLPALGFAADPSPLALPPGAYVRLGSTAWSHPEQPREIVIHPDGKTVASSGSDGTVRIWDVDSGRTLHTLRQKECTPSNLAFSGDGLWLAVQFSDEQVRLYDTAKYRESRAIPMKNGEGLTLSHDGKLLLGGGPMGLPSLLEVQTGQDRMDLPAGRVAALLPAGTLVAVATENDGVQVLEIPSGKLHAQIPLKNVESKRITHLAFHPNGKQLALVLGSTDGAEIRVYELDKTDPVFSSAGDGPLSLIRTGELFARKAGKLAIWNVESGKLLRTMGDGVSLVAISADGRFAATDSGSAFPSPRITLWETKTGDCRNRKPQDLHDLTGLISDPAGGIAFLTGNKLLRCNPEIAQKPFDMKSLEIRCVTPSGSSILAVTEANQLVSVDAPDRVISKVPPAVKFLAVDAQKKWLALATVGEKPMLSLLELGKGTVARSWPLNTQPLSLDIDPDGKRVAILGRDGYTRVWPVTTEAGTDAPAELWKERLTRSQRGGIRFSPDGTQVAFTSLMRVTLCDATTGKVLALFNRTWDDGPYTSVAFSPDGRYLVAGTQGVSGSAVVWELLTQQRAGRYPAGSSVTGVCFLNRGQSVATISADDNVLIWDRTGRRGEKAPTATQLSAAWTKLGELDPAVSYPAVATLTAGGSATLTLIRERLADSKNSVNQWAKELSAREYDVREAATNHLIAAGGPALAALDLVDKAQQTPEWIQRATKIRARIRLAAADLPDPALLGAPLQYLRAVTALEAMPEPEALRVLEAIRDRGGPAGLEAARVLKRQEKR